MPQRAAWLLDAAEKALGGEAVPSYALPTPSSRRFDQEIRRQTTPEYPRWLALDGDAALDVIKRVLSPRSADDNAWPGGLILAMACHPKGWVREPAVRALAAERSGAGSLLAIRATDVVPTIRELAADALWRRAETFQGRESLRYAMPAIRAESFRRMHPQLAGALLDILVP